MHVVFTTQGNGGAGEVLDFLASAVREGNNAAVPAACVPVLTREGRCRPNREGMFEFRLDAQPQRCGMAERALAVCLLVVCSPVMLLTALLIWVCDGRPVIFKQTRYGYRGAPFTVFKFRTMTRHAERLHADLQRQDGQPERLFKLEHDPRATRLGNVLRHTFIDEWPQLVNVVRGEMRLIGPRPLPESDQGHYTRPGHALRLEGLPGMTGLWQVSGRNQLTFDEMCLLDVYYLCHRSVRFDLALAARTFGVVLQQIGLARKTERGCEQAGEIERAGGSDD